MSTDAIRVAIETLLAEQSPDALRDVLHPQCRWDSCVGADEVLATMHEMLRHGAVPEAWTTTTAEDSVVVELSGTMDGSPMSARLVFVVEDGLVTNLVASSDGEPAQSADHQPSPTRAARLTSLAAVFPVRDVAAARKHYELLGFATHAYDDSYGYADRDDVSLHLAHVSDLDPLQNTSAVYLFVDDAAALHAGWVGSGANGRFHEPEPTPYRLLEGAHVDPDGNLLRYGSRVG